MEQENDIHDEEQVETMNVKEPEPNRPQKLRHDLNDTTIFK